VGEGLEELQHRALLLRAHHPPLEKPDNTMALIATLKNAVLLRSSHLISPEGGKAIKIVLYWGVTVDAGMLD